jgi:hypothetical protein
LPFGTPVKGPLCTTHPITALFTASYCTSTPFWCLVIGLQSFLLSSHWSNCAYLSPLLNSNWCSLWTLNPWRLGDIFLWNIGTYLFGETASHPRRLESHPPPPFLCALLHVSSSYSSLCQTHRTVADGCQQGNSCVCILRLSLHDLRRLSNSE